MRGRLLLLMVVALMLVPACGHTDRPEGVVERWLISLNQGKAGRPATYAPDRLSEKILPNWSSRDPGDIDLIEVGKGTFFGPAPGTNNAAVPFRVKRLDGWSITAIAELNRASTGDWQIDAIGAQKDFANLKLPSEGGQRVGGAPVTLWLAALGVALLLVLVSAGLMAIVGRPKAGRSVEAA